MTMPDGTLRLVLGGILLLHGIAHGGAMGSLWWVATRPGTNTGGWTAARLWVAPNISANAATIVAVCFWTVAMVAFVVAALGFLNVVVPAEWWRPAAVIGALVSLVGIGLFAGTWPSFNTMAAVAVNVGVLVAIFILGWAAEPARG
jgi:hypothetical protein